MVDQILIHFGVKDDASPGITKLNSTLGKTKDVSKSLVPGLDSAKQSVTGFMSANAALIGVLVGVGVALGKVLKDHIEYANQVRQLSALSGESTEATSRFLQVLDDYKISAGDALTATRALTKEGHAPSIDTLAKLSDQYLAINSVEEKNAFIMKNLGRGGAAWTEVLQKGSKALLEQGAAVSKNLILTQKMVDDARKAEIAMDNWGDAVTGLKTNLAVGLMPVLTNFVTGINEGVRAAEIMREKGLNPANKASKEYRDALAQAHEEQEAMTAAMLKNSDATNENSDAVMDNAKANEEAAQAMSDRISGMISLIDQMQSAEEDYTEKSKDLTEQRADAEHNLIDLWQEASDAQRDGLGVSEELQEKINDGIAQIDEIIEAEAELAAERDKNTLKFISNILAENLARDGWTTAEFEAFAAQQQAWGLWSADVVAKSKAAWQEAEKITQAINGIPTNKVSTITIVTQQVAQGMTNSQSLGGYDYGSQQYDNIAYAGRDSGGSGIAGETYMIGTGAQPELFTPSTNGTFTPANKLGASYNITINNPKKETAENSIRTALKKLSYLGVAQ